MDSGSRDAARQETTATRRETRSEEETRACAAALAGALPPGSVVALYGGLGSGKTCFVQGLAEGLGITEPVVSPTYTLVNEYRGIRPLYHVDLYRVHDEAEAQDLGLDEYLFGSGVTAIEWAERAEILLPDDAWKVRLAMGNGAGRRRITITPGRNRHDAGGD